jgi:hypothetical protein
VTTCATDTGMRRSTATAVLLAIALLAFPAVSFAQSAGDNQYSDPLQGGNGGNSSNGNATSTGGGGGGGSTPSGSSGGGGNAPVTAPNTLAQAPTTTSTAQEGSPTPKGELPRTGFDVILTIELGLAMLLCGVVLQRMVVLRDRR